MQTHNTAKATLGTYIGYAKGKWIGDGNDFPVYSDGHQKQYTEQLIL